MKAKRIVLFLLPVACAHSPHGADPAGLAVSGILEVQALGPIGRDQAPSFALKTNDGQNLILRFKEKRSAAVDSRLSQLTGRRVRCLGNVWAETVLTNAECEAQ